MTKVGLRVTLPAVVAVQGSKGDRLEQPQGQRCRTLKRWRVLADSINAYARTIARTIAWYYTQYTVLYTAIQIFVCFFDICFYLSNTINKT